MQILGIAILLLLLISRIGGAFSNHNNFQIFDTEYDFYGDFSRFSMNKRNQILKFLQDAGGSLSLTEVHNDLFKKNASNSELEELLKTILAGFVAAKKKRWVLTEAGWTAANQAVAEKPPLPPRRARDDIRRSGQMFPATAPGLPVKRCMKPTACCVGYAFRG